MNEEEHEEEDVTDFTKLIKQFKKALELAKKELELVNAGIEQDKKQLKIKMLIVVKEKDDLVTLLKEYVDPFTWSYANMLGLYTNIMVHELPLIDQCKPIKHKFRRMRLDILIKVKEGVKETMGCRVLRSSQIPITGM